jgi:hypothetical protein
MSEMNQFALEPRAEPVFLFENLEYALIAGNCFPTNLTLNFIAGRHAPLSQALSVGEYKPAPTVSHVWVNPSSQA